MTVPGVNSVVCLDEYQWPFKGTVRTPTVVSGGRHHKTRLVAPFYNGYIYP